MADFSIIDSVFFVLALLGIWILIVTNIIQDGVEKDRIGGGWFRTKLGDEEQDKD